MRFAMFPTLQAAVARWVRPVWNLNDSRWGRSDSDASKDTKEPKTDEPSSAAPPAQEPRSGIPRPSASNGPPDLDDLWRDFNKKINGFFGGGSRGPQPPRGGGSMGPPDMKNAGLGAGVLVAIVLVIWLGTGFFIVQEGQQAVITQFGGYKSTVGAGFQLALAVPDSAP
jgi:membrane protease subunit HflK